MRLPLSIAALVFGSIASAAPVRLNIRDYGARPNDNRLDTGAIQQAIDDATRRAGNGANVNVFIPRGTWDTGALHLKSRVTLQLTNGSVLRGSTNWRDYAKDGDDDGDWQDALISAENQVNCRVVGSGVIDGRDTYRPAGEEGFRGPHALRLVNVRNPRIANVTIRNAGNYAMFAYECRNIQVHKVKVRGGHDGLHVQDCDRIKITRSDFRTGDDCVAGCDNTDATVTDSDFNSSTNGFRFGCEGFVMERCAITGPGEYPHLSTGNRNPKAAFMHFAPRDRNPELASGEWYLRDITVSGCQDLFHYNYVNGLWQQGKPMHAVTIDGVMADLRDGGVFVRPAPGFFMAISNGIINAATGSPHPIINVDNYRWVILNNLDFAGRSSGPLVRLRWGGRTDIDNVTPADRIAVE